MSIITAQRLDSDLPIEISSISGTDDKIDIDAARATVRNIEAIIGGTILNVTLLDDTPVPERLTSDLVTEMRKVFLSSPHYMSFLDTASLVISVYSANQPTVSPSKEDPQSARYTAGLENRLVFACRHWWKENRMALRCIIGVTFILRLGDAEQARKASERRAALVEKMVVALARQHVANAVGQDEISEYLAEYDSLR